MSIVVGTSGHIDHGKTELIKALTGVDTDRWAEEKKRGITIDIGFARYRPGEGGVDIAFVDVPGHERFVHNMLAGASGLDAVLLVVAADEGVMPQTREHLAICDLLGIRHGLVALSRIDLADPELVELSADDVRGAVAGTFLADAPIVPVSAVTGEGLHRLREELARLPADVKERDRALPFRFPVDRSFSVKGFGTVVTGTVGAGELGREDAVWQYPARRPVRIRGFQVHGEAAERIHAGQRAAVNLTGVEKDDIVRGDQLARPHTLLNSYMLNVELRLLADSPRDLTQRSRVRLHLGTSEVIGRLVLLEADHFAPGETQPVQVRLESPVASRYGDRFIIRNYSPIYTLGGGRVIDPAPVKSRRVRKALRERLAALAGEDPVARVEQTVFLQATRGLREAEGFARTGLGGKALQRALAKLSSEGAVFQVDPQERRWLHRETVERLGQFILRVLEQFHRQVPERPGMSRAEVAGKLSALYGEKEVGQILERLARLGIIEQAGQEFRRPGHTKTVSGKQEALLERLFERIRAGGLQPPRRGPLFQACGVDERTGLRLLKLASQNGQLVRVKDDLYYPPETLADIEQRLREYLQAHERITVIDFKDLMGLTRKHAVDLLEHFDARRVTIRLDNERVLRQGP